MNEQAPLNINLDITDTTTGIPVIADGQIVKLHLEKVTQSEVEGKGSTTRWEYKLVEPAPTTDGTTLNPGDFGSTIFENIQLYSKEGSARPDWFKERIATRIDALLGTGDKGNKKGKPERPNLSGETVAKLIGQSMLVKMKVSAYEGRDRNEFAAVYFPGDVQA